MSTMTIEDIASQITGRYKAPGVRTYTETSTVLHIIDDRTDPTVTVRIEITQLHRYQEAAKFSVDIEMYNPEKWDDYLQVGYFTDCTPEQVIHHAHDTTQAILEGDDQ